MSDDHQVEFLSDRSRKRSHREMSHSHSHSHSHYQSRSQWPHHGEPSSSSRPHQHPLSLPGSRYQGHGFDFRRPIISTPSHTDEVVDLTNEPDSPPVQASRRQISHSHSHGRHRHRPPRFGRNIMADVVDLEEDEAGADEVINLEAPSSPEVQFVRATSRPTTLRAAPNRLLDVINLHASLSSQQAFRQEIAFQTRHMGRRRPNRPNVEEFYFTGDTNANVDLTIDLDYQAPGFTIHEPAPTPPPSYKPPTPPPEGFTRTVGEADIVVCPNCDRELGTGDGLGQQIWVAKPCGHVYCGECTINRAVRKRSNPTNPPFKTKPFSKCRVAGCEKPVSQPKSMVQIYL